MTQSRPATTPPTALVPIDTATQAIALVPQSLDGAMQLARWLATSSFLPEKLRGKEGDIFAIVLAGAELGMPPMAALRGVYVVNGKTALESKTKAAICLQRGAALYIKRTEHTPLATTWETLRRGESEPRSYRYTRQEAQESGLLAKDGPWRSFPQRMISHRALGWLCDDVYPDVVLGVANAEDFDGDEISFSPLGPAVGGITVGKIAAAASPPAPVKSTEPAPPGLTDDDIVELITAIGGAGTESTLKQVGGRIRAANVTQQQRDRLVKAYEDQLTEIRTAAATEAADQAKPS